MASMKAKFSFGKKKQHDEEEEVPEAEEDGGRARGPLKAWRRASRPRTRRRATPAKIHPTCAAHFHDKKSPPLPPRPSSTKKNDVPAPVAVEEDAPIPAAPASTPDGPRKSGRCSMMRATLMRRRHQRVRTRTASARCLL